MGTDTVVAPVTSGAAPRPPVWRSPRTLRIGVGAVLVAAVVLRFVAVTPLWLDEAQTVEIARRPVDALLAALRHDGSPPLYYLLLHGWIQVFGTGSIAVRALSGLCSVASLPLMWLLARRLGAGRRTAWAATLLLATSPFAIRYATEARMYALVALLVLLALLAFERVWRSPNLPAFAGGAVVTAALVTTHYWCLFLVAVLGLGALVAGLRGSRAGWRLLAVLAVGCLGFLPWLPSFAFQVAHTGAPWGFPPAPETALWTPRSWSGGGFDGSLLAFAYYALAVLAVAGTAVAARGVVLGRSLRRMPALLIGLAFATLLLGDVVSHFLHSAYASRYSMVALVPFLLGGAVGFGALPQRIRLPALAGVLALGVAVAGDYPGSDRSQAGQVAAALSAGVRRGDVVVFCPDQLGPAVHRLTKVGRQVVFPTMGSPAMVDWVDYKKRNEAADPDVFARQVLRLAGPHAQVWLVYASGYPTFGDDCDLLFYRLRQARGEPLIPVHLHASTFEHERLAVFPAR